MIELDGGSATRSNRTQFIKRIVELAKEIGLKIRLIYYPPYHSKYNPIERCWAALENYWHGAILGSVESALGNMTEKYFFSSIIIDARQNPASIIFTLTMSSPWEGMEYMCDRVWEIHRKFHLYK